MKGYMREDVQEYLEIYHFTPSDYEKACPAWPIRLGCNEAKPNYHIGPRTTPYYYLLMVIDGEGTFFQDGMTFPLRQGDLFCLLPQVTHEYYTNPKHPLRKIFIAFDGPMALELLKRTGLSPEAPHLSGALTPNHFTCLYNFRNSVRKASGKPSDLTRLFYFHQLFDSLAVPALTDDSSLGQPESWLQKGQEYIQIHYADGINVERVSAYVGVERTHFTKQFTKCYGITPIRYIQSLKLQEAKQLLEQTDYALAEIAASLGYTDLFSFSKAFKKMEGISPTAYRNEWRKSLR